MSIINLDHIMVDQDFENKKDLFYAIGQVAYEKGVINSISDFVSGLFNREKEFSTGFEKGIAIPHTLNQTVKCASVFVVKNKREIVWDNENKKVNFIICLAIPENGGAQHLNILSNIARKLIDDEFTDCLLKCEKEQEIFNLCKTIPFE